MCTDHCISFMAIGLLGQSSAFSRCTQIAIRTFHLFKIQHISGSQISGQHLRKLQSDDLYHGSQEGRSSDITVLVHLISTATEFKADLNAIHKLLEISQAKNV